MLRLTDYRVLTLDCYGTLIDWEIGIWGFWCRQPTGIGDNEIWRIAKRNGILYLPDVGSKTTSFFSAFAGISASN